MRIISILLLLILTSFSNAFAKKLAIESYCSSKELTSEIKCGDLDFFNMGTETLINELNLLSEIKFSEDLLNKIQAKGSSLGALNEQERLQLELAQMIEGNDQEDNNIVMASVGAFAFSGLLLKSYLTNKEKIGINSGLLKSAKLQARTFYRGLLTIGSLGALSTIGFSYYDNMSVDNKKEEIGNIIRKINNQLLPQLEKLESLKSCLDERKAIAESCTQ